MTALASTVPPPPFVPFQTAPTLDSIPDDLLHEILRHLPTLCERHVSFGGHPIVPSAALVRTPTLRALSQTSRLLRSRCLAMAWWRLELCGAKFPDEELTFEKPITEAIKAAVRVLGACPHLLALIQTATVVFPIHPTEEVMPAFAACLATLPNLTSIQVIYAHPRISPTLKRAFQGKRLPSVRSISLPCMGHEIIKYCPNLEEVICTQGIGHEIIRALLQGRCRRVRVLKGLSAPLTRLYKLLPNLTHISVNRDGDMTSLVHFPLLDTIEMFCMRQNPDVPLTEFMEAEIKHASKILKENKSQAAKTVIVTEWRDLHFRRDEGHLIKEVIKV